MRFLIKALKKHGLPKQIVTDKLGSYKAVSRELNLTNIQETELYENNQIENSHLHFRRQEKIMNRFGSIHSLVKFTALQSQFHHQRHLEKRQNFKNLRQTSIDVWNQILAA